MNELQIRVLEIQKFAASKVSTSFPKSFVHHFDAVCKAYDCTPAEVFDMKAAARADRDNAIVCFKAMFETL